MLPTIYVAHTYGRRHGLPEFELEANALKSIEIGRQLILKNWNPFIPNLYHWVHKGWLDSPREDRWLEIVSHWLQFCDALFVAEKPAWRGSGVQYEIDNATDLCIPIYYSLREIPRGGDYEV